MEYGKEGSDAKHRNLEQEIPGRTDYGAIRHTDAARSEHGMMRQRDRVCLTEGLIVAVQWHTERFKCIAVRRDRLLIRSRTAIFHWSGRGPSDRQEARISIEAQCEKQNDQE